MGRTKGTDYHTDDDSNILNYDGSLVNISAIQLGDYIRSIDFIDSNENQAGNLTQEIACNIMADQLVDDVFKTSIVDKMIFIKNHQQKRNHQT